MDARPVLGRLMPFPSFRLGRQRMNRIEQQLLGRHLQERIGVDSRYADKWRLFGNDGWSWGRKLLNEFFKSPTANTAVARRQQPHRSAGLLKDVGNVLV